MKTINPERTRCPYDVGDVLITASSAQPADRWPGTSWQQIKDIFPLAAGDTYKAGSIGGEATHLLTINELPSHTHQGKTRQIGKICSTSDLEESSNVARINVQGAEKATGAPDWKWATYQWTDTPDSTGGGLAHNNMPPYKVFYMWQRTA